MSIGTLTPFDYDLIAMIENITKNKVTTYLEEGYIRLEFSVLAFEEKFVNAIKDAVAGRIGDKFIGFEIEDEHQNEIVVSSIAKVRFDSDPEQWPTQIKYELTEPISVDNSTFARKAKEVEAVLFGRDNIERILEFTGGGTLTIPVALHEPATYEFPTENGVLMTVKEGFYIVKEKTHFYLLSKKDFEIDFERK